MEQAAAPENRYSRKKAATRRKIVAAGNQLFSARGYESVSMEEIAEEADLAVRTLYLHFDSKAGILLDYLDGWLDDYIDAICTRPLDEPIAQSAAAALEIVSTKGWNDDRTFDEMPVRHPLVEYIGHNVQLAGHILQSWVRAQDRLTADARERGSFAPDSLEPRARAAAHFASWLATMLAFNDAFDGGDLPAVSSHEVGRRITQSFGEGIDRQR